MPEEIINNEPIENSMEGEVSAADIITEMRQNTVPKDKYNKVMEENQKLMRALANGETVQVEAPQKPTALELHKEWANQEGKSSIQIAKDTLALREAMIDEGLRDPFLPNGKDFVPEAQDLKDAEDVAALLQWAIDGAEGNSGVFNSLLASKIIDSPRPKAKTNRR
jgi:hypothetical protein